MPTVDPSTVATNAASIGVTTKASNALSPPANSLLVALVGVTLSTAAPVVTVTDSLGSHLTWNRLAATNGNMTGGFAGAEVWCAYTSAAQTSMTVSVNVTAAANIELGVIVFAGASPTQNGASNANGITTSGATITLSLTTARAGSWVVGSIANWSNTTAPTIPGGQTDVWNGFTFFQADSNNASGWWGQGPNAVTANSGTNVTVNDTAPTAAFQEAIAEIVPVPPDPGPTDIIPDVSPHLTFGPF